MPAVAGDIRVARVVRSGSVKIDPTVAFTIDNNGTFALTFIEVQGDDGWQVAETIYSFHRTATPELHSSPN